MTLETASKFEMVPFEDKNVRDPNGVQLDKDDVEHMSWIFNRAVERADKFKIEGVTYNLTMKVRWSRDHICHRITCYVVSAVK